MPINTFSLGKVVSYEQISQDFRCITLTVGSASGVVSADGTTKYMPVTGDISVEANSTDVNYTYLPFTGAVGRGWVYVSANACAGISTLKMYATATEIMSINITAGTTGLFTFPSNGGGFSSTDPLYYKVTNAGGGDITIKEVGVLLGVISI